MRNNPLTLLWVTLVLTIWTVLTATPVYAEEKKITLSEEHLRAVARERRTIINYDGRFIGAPFLCDRVELDELVEWHFSLLDRGRRPRTQNHVRPPILEKHPPGQTRHPHRLHLGQTRHRPSAGRNHLGIKNSKT